jgi:glyoxylase I family protein
MAVRDLEALSRRLEGAGVALTRSRSGRRAIFCRDPDGNAIELIESEGEERLRPGKPRGGGEGTRRG